MLRFSRQLTTSITLLFGLMALASQVVGQAGQNPKPPESDDVVRVNSTLVQTDVMVFDKQGRFVNDLNQTDFDLRIDGKQLPVQFFERVTAGTANEEAQLAAARGLSPTSGKEPSKSVPLDRGRPVFFYVDDLHLSIGSLAATRKLLLRFIDQEMGQNDQAVITSASGGLGFLQQLSNNRTVLHTAVDKLSARSTTVRDLAQPPMSEYQALQIDRYDRNVLDYFIDETIRQNPGTTREMAANIVNGRSSTLLNQAGNITRNTLAGLEGLVRSSSKLTGRKLIFFISDGFFVDQRNSDTLERLRKITDAAARTGVVIYSVDARGLVASLDDISVTAPFDPTGRLARSSGGELFASQDAMFALAKDTGGRAVFNTNALDTGVSNALKETSVYYLLAWRPEQEPQASNKFRHISVTIPSRKDLTVRVRQGFFDAAPTANTAPHRDKEPAKTVKPESPLREALAGMYPRTELPLGMILTYTNVPDKGMRLTVSLQIRTDSLAFQPDGEKQKALIDVAGAIYDQQGKPAGGVSEKVTITTPSLDQARRPGQEFNYTSYVFLKPGLYQVRMGVRDVATEKIATSQEWIEIPDLASHKLLMSSIIAGERIVLAPAGPGADPNAAQVRAGHRVHRNSFLRFLIFIYNATPSTADSQPDIALQVQILRDQQPVMTAPLKKISTEGVTQFDQLPYAADISLDGMAAGEYLLKVTAIDRVAKTSTTQLMRFEIE